jgi:hypothetical protein
MVSLDGELTCDLPDMVSDMVAKLLDAGCFDFPD